MQEIKEVAIIGAGAMGAFFASKFYEAVDISTYVIARGQRYERLAKDGLIVNSKHYTIPVVHPDEVTQPADLIIVALKHDHLPHAVHDLKNFVDEQSTIVSVMNGLDSEVYIGSIYGMDKMLFAISLGIDAVRQGNQVTYTNPGVHYFGEATNTQLSSKVLRVQNAFKRANIAYKTPIDMMRMMWWKFMVNVGVNQPSAVMRATYGVFQTSIEAQKLMESLMREVVELAKFEGVNLVEKDIEDWYPILNTLSPQGKTSMLQDIEAGRRTEVEMFAGKVVAFGETHGIPTPVNQTLLRMIRVLESEQMA